MQHYPVLLSESLEYLAVEEDGVYLDATAGLGNHTKAIAQRAVQGVVIANDRDAESLELARQNSWDAIVERLECHIANVLNAKLDQWESEAAC